MLVLKDDYTLQVWTAMQTCSIVAPPKAMSSGDSVVPEEAVLPTAAVSAAA